MQVKNLDPSDLERLGQDRFISNRHPNFLTTFKLKQTSTNIKYFKSEAKFSTFLQFGSMEAVKQNEKCALVLLKANE